MNYWLIKSEPEEFSIDDLKKQKTTWWEGVRNYQARNFMMNDMKIGDQILFYHSNAEPTGVVGIASVSKEAAPDLSAQDKKSDYFDVKASKENPRWFCVQIKFERKFDKCVTLAEIKANPSLKNMDLVRPGQRLSVQVVRKDEFETIFKLATES